MNKPVRVLICDDQIAVRNHLRRTLASKPWIVVVGEARGGREGVQLAIELAPDIIIMDVSMPDVNGIQATQRILEAVPEVKVLMFSAEASKAVAQRAFSAGAHGYMVKSGEVEELINALGIVMQGYQYVSSALCSEESAPGREIAGTWPQETPAAVVERQPVRVLLVDDTACVRERLADLLSALPGVEVVGQAAEANSASGLIKNLQPDVLIMDIELPGQSGMDLLAGLPKSAERPLVIILSNYDYPILRRTCAKLGADFYFYKPVDFEKVIEVCENLARRIRRKGQPPPPS